MASLTDAGVPPKMISFAQNFEDVTLQRALGDVKNGFYVDLGAFDPVEDSVTAWFYSQGWRGVNVEPNPKFHRRLCEQRPDETNLQIAISEQSGVQTLHALDGLSSIVPKIMDHHAARGRDAETLHHVDTLSLADLFEAHVGDRVVDFLKVDVEGAEAAVLSPYDFKHVRPRIIVVESTEPDGQAPTHESWEPELLTKGYLFAWFDGLNRFYVREEDAWRAKSLAMPPNVFDNFSIRSTDRRVTSAPEEPAHAERQVEAERRRLQVAEATAEALEAERKSMVEQLDVAAVAMARLQIKNASYRDWLDRLQKGEPPRMTAAIDTLATQQAEKVAILQRAIPASNEPSLETLRPGKHKRQRGTVSEELSRTFSRWGRSISKRLPGTARTL